MIVATDLDVCAPDGRPLLRRLSFQLTTGNRYSFSGPNGCGKSTLLRHIAGLEPDSPQLVRNIPLGQISYLATRPLDLLLPWASVSTNVSFFLRREAIAPRWKFVDFLAAVGYKPNHQRILETEIYKLSSGQQALVALYCALSQSPKLLVADEIFSTLSAPLRSSVASLLVEMGLVIACSSHDADFVGQLKATVISLDNHMAQDD